MKETFETPGSLVLVLRVPAGLIEVEVVEGTQTTVELDPDEDARIACRERSGGHEVLAEVRSSRFRNRDYRLLVQAPPGAELRVETKSADVRARGRFAVAEVNTASGDVELEDVDGAVKVNGASANVRVGRAGGEATVNTASGDVELTGVGGAAKVRSASGDVSIGAAGSSVSVQTASGDVAVSSVTEGRVDLQSASGDLEVGVRRGSNLWVDARSLSGETSSELEVGEDEPGGEGPLVELRASTLSGDISIVRAR